MALDSLQQSALLQKDRSVSKGRGQLPVSHQDHRTTGVAKLSQMLTDFSCMARIEVASGFIRKDQFWRRHHGSGHGHSLPLPRTELMGQMVHPMFQIQGIQQGVGALR